jgi:hypothetical protein
MPDGEGGRRPRHEWEPLYHAVRAQAATGFWSNFTDRRIYEIVSEHNGRTYTNRVGDLTEDCKFVLGVFESTDDRGLRRYTVQSLTSTIHVDPEKVRSVVAFADYHSAVPTEVRPSA